MGLSTQTINVRLPHHRYSVLVGSGLLAYLGQHIRETVGVVAPTAAVYADEQIHSRYGELARQSLESAGYRVTGQAVTGGEGNKNLGTVANLYSQLAQARLERASPIIAVGGGVIGDTIGFLAATYLRGVPFVQCPTTLLAMVDASVGGKVGVNLPEGKNLVGSFHQPAVVLADVDTLNTLDHRNLRCGFAECIKHAVIRDETLFQWLEQHADGLLALDTELTIELILRNVAIKARVVEADEKEAGERAHLNFGHTFAHSIESSSGYKDRWLHGEAVAVGMVAAARLAESIGICELGVSKRISGLLSQVGLPVQGAFCTADELIELMMLDKKVSGGDLRFILPDRIGHVQVVSGIDRLKIVDAWRSVGAE